MARKRIFAVDIGIGSVKVVDLAQGRSGFQVNRVGSADRGDDLAGAVKQAMNAAGARGDCVVSILRSQLVPRHLTGLPTGLGVAALKEVIELQAENELPFEPDTFVYDFFNERRAEGGLRVDLFAARLDDVNELLQPVREAGGKPIGVIPSIFGVSTLLKAQSDQRTLLVLNVNHETTDMALMRNGLVTFTRNLPVGVTQFEQDPNDAVRRWLAELRRTILSIQRGNGGDETNVPFSEIWLWGDGANLRFEAVNTDDDETDADDAVAPSPSSPSMTLAALIRDQFGVTTHVGGRSELCENEGPLDTMTDGWTVYGNAIGIALQALNEEIDANLIPLTEKKKKAQVDRTRRLGAYAGSAAAVMLAMWFGAGQINAYQKDKVDALDSEIRQYQTERAAAAKTLGEMQAMSHLKEPEYGVLDVLRELTALMPDRRPIAVTSFMVETNGTVTASFEAESHDALTEAVTKIGRSPWFTNVTPGQITTQEKNNRPVRQFTLSMKLAENANILAAKQIGTTVGGEGAGQVAGNGGAGGGGGGGRGNVPGGGPGNFQGGGNRGTGGGGGGGNRGAGGGGNNQGGSLENSARGAGGGGPQSIRVNGATLNAGGNTVLREGGQIRVSGAEAVRVAVDDGETADDAKADEGESVETTEETPRGGVYVPAADGDRVRGAVRVTATTETTDGD
ncbi:MAG: pilus assembly protein PilM [Candidatus Poribacteria bacterium]|nr:pilus assembly protein PilM [Candidatus Poribacteria bacterium]